MIVIGGCYREVTTFPEKSVLFGSGLKSACALSKIVPNIKLLSSVSEFEKTEAEVIAASYNVQARFINRLAPIEFHYLTPLTTPRIFGLGQRVEIEYNESDKAVVFGLLEADPVVKAKQIVFDPQKPNGPLIDTNRLKCEELIIVLNRHEANEIADDWDPHKSSRYIANKYQAKAVIVKCGGPGAVVYESNKSTWVGAYPSSSVWPIGSGDIYTAFFAAAWMELGKPILEAAQFASMAVSNWTSNADVLPLDLINIQSVRSTPLPEKYPTIYLAGPFFNLGQNWVIETTKTALESLGAKVFSPLHEVGRGGDEVAIEDLKGLDNSTSVLALLDEYDTGTVFEIGYAIAKGIKVVGYSQNPTLSQFKMIRGSGIPIYSDFSTAVYQSVWAGI